MLVTLKDDIVRATEAYTCRGLIQASYGIRDSYKLCKDKDPHRLCQADMGTYYNFHKGLASRCVIGGPLKLHTRIHIRSTTNTSWHIVAHSGT